MNSFRKMNQITRNNFGLTPTYPFCFLADVATVHGGRIGCQISLSLLKYTGRYYYKLTKEVD